MTDPYDYRGLAKKYARYLPRASVVDYEDIYQAMMLASLEYQSIKSMRWAALDLIKREWVRARPLPLKIERTYSLRLDTICGIAQLISRWPWLLGLLMGESLTEIGAPIGISQQRMGEKLARIRKEMDT